MQATVTEQLSNLVFTIQFFFKLNEFLARRGDKNPKLNLFLEEKQVFPLRKSSAFGLVRKGEINFDKI